MFNIIWATVSPNCKTKFNSWIKTRFEIWNDEFRTFKIVGTTAMHHSVISWVHRSCKHSLREETLMLIYSPCPRSISSRIELWLGWPWICHFTGIFLKSEAAGCIIRDPQAIIKKTDNIKVSASPNYANKYKWKKKLVPCCKCLSLSHNDIAWGYPTNGQFPWGILRPLQAHKVALHGHPNTDHHNIYPASSHALLFL